MPHAARESPPGDPEYSGQGPFVGLDPRLEHLPSHLEVRRVLGEGGSSVVYEAFHTRLKVAVAVKVLSVRNQQARQRMSREAELYALLDDPRIPRVYDVNDLPDGTPYVVMEMVPGQPLEDLLQERGALSPELAISITKQVLATLASVHGRGVLHRDVKPANVILNFSDDGACRVRLVDFGIAKMSAQEEQAVVTQRGSLIGTPQYMAPERLVGEEADSSSDTYATGVMLYEMLAGVPPFEGESVSAIVVSVLRERPRPLLARCPDISPALDELVSRAMAREPAQRFASASQMLEALEAIERERTSQVAVLDTPRAAPLASPPKRAGRGGELVLLGMMVATLATLAFARWYRMAHEEPLHVAVPAIEQTQVAAPPPPMAVAPIEWSPRVPKPVQPVAQTTDSEPERAEEGEEPPAPTAEPVPVDESVPAEQVGTPMQRSDELLERPIPPPRRTTIDYAKLLPDNPY
jgi:predicted Ser/Thr protein kinase